MEAVRNLLKRIHFIHILVFKYDGHFKFLKKEASSVILFLMFSNPKWFGKIDSIEKVLMIM